MFNIHTIYKQSLSNPLQKQQRTPRYLEGKFLASGDEFPSTLVSSLVTTALPLVFSLFTPFPDPHYTVYKGDINNHGLLRLGQYLLMSMSILRRRALLLEPYFCIATSL